MLRRARRARVPIDRGCRQAVAEPTSLPYVLATDVVWVGAGEGFPLEAIAHAIAARLGEHGAPLAARVPRAPRARSSEQLVASFARKNAIVARPQSSIPAADLPVLTLNQIRLLLRLAQAHGPPATSATAARGRGDARRRLRLARRSPRAPRLARSGRGWAVPRAPLRIRARARSARPLSEGLAYGATRALGEAARIRYALAPTRRRAGASRGAP